MSDKDPKNPFEELQKQLQQFLRNPNVKVGFNQPEGGEMESEQGPRAPAQEAGVRRAPARRIWPGFLRFNYTT